MYYVFWICLVMEYFDEIYIKIDFIVIFGYLMVNDVNLMLLKYLD